MPALPRARGRRGRPMGADRPAERARLRDIIRRNSLLRDRDFVLVSGRSSGFFFDMKRTMFDPEGASLAAELLFDRIKDEAVDYVGGLETGAIPIVAALCVKSWPQRPIKGFFVRKANKGHGTDQQIDGLLESGSRVILFEDVTTTGGSAMQAADAVRERHCAIVKIIALVDRLEGAAQNFRDAGIEFESLFTWHDFR
jgi:orotate phosphoribosyltransferase